MIPKCRWLPVCLFFTAMIFLPSAGCAIFGLFSLIPGSQGPPGMDGTNGTDGINGTNGTNGADGADGADGSIRIYGDGSVGDITVTQTTNLFDLQPDGNVQFRNLTIDAGGELRVPSGTVLRCSGAFVNNGLLTVLTAETANFADPMIPGAGISHQIAQHGVSGDGSIDRFRGGGGVGVSEAEAHFILSSDPRGGGAGASSGFITGSGLGLGGDGGGRLIVLARESLTNAGQIGATGNSTSGPGGGGGGGGIVILASPGPVMITGTGTILAFGGDGGSPISSPNYAGGGGGGGGIVHLISPSIANNGVVDISGGAGGGPNDTGANTDRSSGGGGGGSGGSGGNGGTASSIGQGNVLESGIDGDIGFLLQTVADPTSLF